MKIEELSLMWLILVLVVEFIRDFVLYVDLLFVIVFFR